MKNKLLVLFSKKNNKTKRVYKTIKNFGYDIALGYANTFEKKTDFLHLHPCDMLIVVCQTIKNDLDETVIKKISGEKFFPWIVVCENTDKDEILKLLNAGCRDVILLDEINRLELVIHRLLLEAERDNKNKAIQYKLLAEKEKLEMTLGSIGDGVITVDVSERIVMMNNGAEMITGWTSDVAINRHFTDVFKVVEKNSEKPLDNLLELTLGSGETIGLKRDTVLISRDGDEKFVSACISPIKVSTASIGVVIVFRDITRIRKAEEGLKRYQLLSENANDIIMFSDIDGKIIEANSAAFMAYGYTKGEILNKSIFELVTPDKRLPVRTQPYNSKAEGVFYEAIARRKDGSTFNLEVSLQGEEIGQSKVLLSIQRDITERKQAQKELERARMNAEAANLAKSEFLANMSHEIRTPLNGMMGMIDLTLMTDLTEKQKDNLYTAKECASNLLNLINDILDFSKIEARKLNMENIEFDFAELVDQTIKPHNIEAWRKGLMLKCHIDPLIPRIVNGDPHRLTQIINNLLGNAVKFTDEGEINLSARLKESGRELVGLEIQISDTGVGMDSKVIEKIFDTFSQADNSITRKYGGSGLGLAISRQLVEMMGGTICVKSEKGKGSTFCFNVKLASARAMSSTRHNIRDIAKSKQPLQILLAEDDKINQVVISRILKEAGHFVETVNNGMEALQAIKERTVDVVLMDIQMPQMDGIEAVKRIRKCERGTGSHIPIIALTAYALQGDKERYLSVGMDDYIPKPVQFAKLIETVEKIVERSKTDDLSEAFSGGDYNKHLNLINKDLAIENCRNIKKVIDRICTNIESFKSALDKENFLLIEKYAHEIKQLSTTASIIAIKKPAFKIELAARQENLAAVVEHFNYVLKEFDKLKDKYANNDLNEKGV